MIAIAVSCSALQIPLQVTDSLIPMLDALVERLTVGSVSSLLIVPVAVVVAPRMAFVTAETVTVKVSLPSVIVSPQTVTSMLPELVFAAIVVEVPVLTKSTPAPQAAPPVAVPFASE